MEEATLPTVVVYIIGYVLHVTEQLWFMKHRNWRQLLNSLSPVDKYFEMIYNTKEA
jgi:hypothetical protein